MGLVQIMNVLHKKLDALPCSTLPSQDRDASVSITARKRGYAGLWLGEAKFVFWRDLGNYFA
jgi:hypothetical protein